MSLVSLLVVLLGGGLISAVVALLKARPERDNTVVAAAQQANVILDDLNHTLISELNEQRELLQACLRDRRRLEDQLEERQPP